MVPRVGNDWSRVRTRAHAMTLQPSTNDGGTTRRWLLLPVLAAVLLLLVANGLLLDRCLYYRARWFEAQALMRPPGHSLVADRRELDAPRKPGRLLLVGDSRVFRLPTPSALGIDFGPVSPLNKGIPGGGVVTALTVLSAEGMALEPLTVFAQVGINDVMNDAPEVAVARIRRFVDDFRVTVSARGATPAISTVIPLGRRHLLMSRKALPYTPARYREWNRTVAAVNGWIRAYAATHAVRLVDLDRAMRDSSGRPQDEWFDADGVHLSAAGNRLLWQHLRDSVRAQDARHAARPLR